MSISSMLCHSHRHPAVILDDSISPRSRQFLPLKRRMVLLIILQSLNSLTGLRSRTGRDKRGRHGLVGYVSLA